MDQDLRLLLAETRVLWGTDSWGRHAEPPLCALAISGASHRVIVAPGLSRGLSARLRQLLDAAAQGAAAPRLRPALEPAVSLLAAAGIPAEVRGGPSFLAEPPLAERAGAGPPLAEPPLAAAGAERAGAERAGAVAAGTSIMCSGSPDDVCRVTACRRPPSWDAGEWSALLGGQLGPWAMAVDRDQVLSICHSPRDSPAGTEAGVWTHPEFRGNGYAGASTAAWASLLRRRDDRPLFYSAADANSASQRVAARLGLASIGWIWSLPPPTTGAGAAVSAR